MEKIDNSDKEEAVKEDARQFMSGLLSNNAADIDDTEPATSTNSDVDGVEIIKAWKSTYNAASDKDNTLMEQFWSMHDPQQTSIWKMVYDEADYNENLVDTIAIVTTFMEQTGMAEMKDECFGIVHTLETLEIEGLWFFNGETPEKLFGANEETSWYTWTQIGPDATDLVKDMVAKIITPTDGKINDTQIF